VFCHNCGSALEDHSACCSSCGTPTSTDTTTQDRKAIKPLIAGGYLCGLAALLLVPLGFGLAGCAIGIINLTKGRLRHGIAQIVIAVTCGTVGMYVDVPARHRKRVISSNFGSGDDSDVSSMLQSVSEQFRQLQKWLLLRGQPDLRILAEFRDAINRLRQTAWALHQYGEMSADESSSNTVSSILAGERIRTACQLGKLIEADLENPEIRFQKDQLLGLYEAMSRLAQHVHEYVGN